MLLDWDGVFEAGRASLDRPLPVPREEERPRDVRESSNPEIMYGEEKKKKKLCNKTRDSELMSFLSVSSTPG